jgi:diaminohydroxyphosphoribosylaminopyrimidine deaminase/5-amino-6-(5-phosphoribosylamino)uracil reductase
VNTAADDLLVICSSPDSNARQALELKCVRVVQLSDDTSRPKFSAVLKLLGEMEITSLLVEGGSMVNTSTLVSGQVDKILLYYAPTLMGPAAIPFLAEVGERNPALCVKQMELHRFGDDFAVEGYLRDPYAE